MRYSPRLAFGRWGEDPEFDAFRLRAQLEAIVQINEAALRRYGSQLPGLFQSGVRYVPPDVACRVDGTDCTADGDDPWGDLLDVLEQGRADCEDLCCYRAAELRVRHGVAAVCDVEIQRVDAQDRVHVFVRWPDGRIEDPSRALGMRG